MTEQIPAAKTGPGSASFVAGEPPGGAVRLAPLAVLAVVTLAVTIRDPHQHGSWGVCPTYAIFGIYCPGCGSLRALHDLATGHLGEAIGHNALVLPAMAFLAYAGLGRAGPGWARIWLIAMIAFTVARNFPGSPLAP